MTIKSDARKIACRKCRRSFLTSGESKKVHDALQGQEGAAGENHLAYCPQCRQQMFAETLLGDRLQPVAFTGLSRKRRIDPLKAVRHDSRLNTTVYKSQCYICNQGCDATVHVRDGVVVRVEGDTSSEVTEGTLCAKGLASREILYHQERLLYPMKRSGARGEGKWERITWDEAFDTIVRRLRSTEKRYGPESIVLATGTNRGWVRYFNRFANAYGKQWMGPGIAQCFYPRITGQTLVLGTNALENPDYTGTRCMVIWGCNPGNTWPVKGMGMMEARRQGAHMIVIDPVFSEAASKSDLWLQLRPGTDAALALGMLHVIMVEGLYDSPFVEKWCSGFDALAKRIEEYPPKKVEQITWVPADLLREAARLYATSKPASITQCLSIDQNADTISTCRSIAMLAGITGNIDVPGGNLMTMLARMAPVPDETGTKFLSAEQHTKRLGKDRYPLLAGERCVLAPSAHNHAVWTALLTGQPYPVKAVYCHGSNMLRTYVNTNMVAEALQKLEFFAVADLFLTETAAIADIVLPAASWMERSSVTRNEQTSIDHLHLQQKVLQRGECRSDLAILNELAERLGFGDRMFPTEEAYFDFTLKSSGFTFDEFKRRGGVTFPQTYRKYESDGFRTPSGKIHLYDERLAALGEDPLPSYREPSESPVSTPEVAREYPFIITTGGRVPVFRHSELRNIPVLREIVPELMASIHPDAARALGISDGDTVVVESQRGSMEAKAYVTEGIDPRVIQVPSHWPGVNNVNLLMDNERCAPLIGSAQLRCQLCRVRKK
jgi:anaerobic selenocysteine-containing dehydrogenase